MKNGARFTKHDQYRYSHARIVVEASKLEASPRLLVYDRYAHKVKWEILADVRETTVYEVQKQTREAVEILCRYIDAREGRGIRSNTPPQHRGRIRIMEKMK